MPAITCEAGHESEWDDYCSVCGTAIVSAGVPAAASSVTKLSCSNCGASYRESDVFCESCGLDFATGTLPGAAASTPAASAPSPRIDAVVVVSVDEDWFAKAVAGEQLELPNPLPSPRSVSLPGAKALIGRASASRGVFPEVDVAALTEDPAVSSRHALIERSDDGWTITDVGSTNGTLVGTDLSTAHEIAAGTPVPFPPGTSAWLGAWTRVAISN